MTTPTKSETVWSQLVKEILRFPAHQRRELITRLIQELELRIGQLKRYLGSI